MFFERLRRSSTTHRRPAATDRDAEPRSPPDSPPPLHEWIRKLRRTASPARTVRDESIRRTTSERAPARHSTSSTRPHGPSSARPHETLAVAVPRADADADADATDPAGDGRSSPPAVEANALLLADTARRPVYRRASASMPVLAPASPSASAVSLYLPAPAVSQSLPTSPLEAFVAAGLDATSLRTGPAAHTAGGGLVHPRMCFAECAAIVEEWPAPAEDGDDDAATITGAVAADHVRSVARSAGASSSRSRGRTMRSHKRTRTAGSVLRPLSVESVRRHAAKRRRGRRPLSRPALSARAAAHRLRARRAVRA